MSANLSRRSFLRNSAALSGALVVGFHIPQSVAQTGAPRVNEGEVNAWVVVYPDDTVVIRYARSEMGQGSMTSAAMLVAEELACDWNKVRVEYADVNEHFKRNRIWGDMSSVGSRTIRLSQAYLRKGGAQARAMLVAAAAQKWSVPPGECSARDSVITHGPSGRSTSFGAVASAAAAMPAPDDVKLKEPGSWTLIGKPIPRVDIPDTVMGRQRYGIDVQLPGMVYAAVAQCPVFGGRAKSFDASKIQGRRGIIKAVSVDGGACVAVIADNWWRAKEALKEVSIDWDVGENGKVSSASILEYFREGHKMTGVPVAAKTGDLDGALASAAKLIEGEYYTPYLAHATLEPMGATALVKDGRVEVWCSTQSGEGSLTAAATAAGVPPTSAEVHKMQVGGGFGRRGGSQDFVRSAVLIAKEMEGTPVKSLWTREEDTQHDFYRPAALYRLKAGLDAAGEPSAWYTRIASPSIFASLLKLPLKNGIDNSQVEGFSEFPYGFPNVRNEYVQRDTHVPVGFWRTVGWSQNPFARECFLDEVALAAGKDPYQFRRTLLSARKGEKSERALAVLEAVAKAADWGKPLPKGVFRGIAVTEPYEAYVAAVIELSMNSKGEVKVHRVVEGIDCGYVVNPDNITAQLQGSIVFSLTATFRGEITLKDGRVEQSNFHDYPMVRMPEMPKVEVVLAPSGGFWGGVGEPGQAPIPPALCNAIFAASGRRIRSLPLKNHGITLVPV